ncbi:gliding motility-associated protein GldE [Rhodocytophaga aerolata]|uniref:Gliding motility-associated protein GldE n=1 Tax=Rhodocytophaga aerolata TaxID=455078 RepID=A0ABT8R6B4_9BACT|nr:gliding motility-associated protein GldE [Rhodocytophaga aerolata]MDO1446813.1 gliding motility-associated protein GldE [Rhodocytophaga aerolata]
MQSHLDTGDPLSGWVLLTAVLSTSFVLYSSVIFILLILSALISGAEALIFSFTEEQRTGFKNSTVHAEKLIARLLDHPKKLLATVLITNFFTHVAITITAVYMAWNFFGLDRAYSGSEVVLFTFTVAFVIIFFGEMLPRVYASSKNLSSLRFTVYIIAFMQYLWWPLSILLIMLGNIIEDKVGNKGYKLSVEELDHALQATTGTETTEEEKEILRGIVNFGNTLARQIMRSRIDVTAFPSSLNFHELMDKINKSGYSRIPIYHDTIDRIEGVLYIKDLLPHLHRNEYFNWRQFIRPGFFIPENKKIDDLLQDFQQKRVHMAIVVDEYGGTAGLITLEDIIEEIMGEINDEFDEEHELYSQLDEHTFLFEGKTLLHDFCKIMEVSTHLFDEVRGDSESLGGLLLELFNGLPKTGDKITYAQFSFLIVSVDSKRIKRVKISVHPQTDIPVEKAQPNRNK